MCHSCNHWHQCWSLTWMSYDQLINHGVRHHYKLDCILTQHNEPPVARIWRWQFVHNLVFVISNEWQLVLWVEIMRWGKQQHNIFHCRAIPLNVNFTNFDKKTSWVPRHILYIKLLRKGGIKRLNYYTMDRTIIDISRYFLNFAHFVSFFGID